MEKIKVKKDMPEVVSDLIERSIKEIQRKQDFAILGVPGGRSVSAIFKVLKTKEINWKRVHIFMIDERQVPLTDKESNFRIVKEELIDHINIPEKNIHPYDTELELEDYERLIASMGRHYDIVLLSSGEEGHIGALYPDHHSIKDESRYYTQMDDSPKPPKERMSISKNMLLRSKIAIILFIGEGKREALKKFNNKKLNYRQCPAKLVNSIKKSYLITDLS